MKMLSNSLYGLIPQQKYQYLLYKTCILPITFYKFPLWYYNNVPLAYPLKKLRKMQRRAVLWILGAFCTSPTLEIKIIAGLVSIYLHLQKLSKYHKFRTSTLSNNHAIKFLLERRHIENTSHYHLLLENITHK